VGEFGEDEFVHGEVDGVGGAGDGEDDGVAPPPVSFAFGGWGDDDSGSGAGEESAGADGLVGEHAEEFAEAGEGFGEGGGDGVEGVVAARDACAAVEDDGVDVGAGGEGGEKGFDLGGVIFGDGVEGVGVAVGFEEAADELAGFVLFDGAGVGAGDDGAGDGALSGGGFVVLVAHGKLKTQNAKPRWSGRPREQPLYYGEGGCYG